MPDKKNTTTNAIPLEDYEKIVAQLELAQEGEKRALADYQNLQRRQQEERARLVQLAASDLIQSLVEPLNNLQLAAKNLDDQGLNMVISQFLQALTDNGLEVLGDDLIGQPFDVELMEAVERKDQSIPVEKATVQTVTSPGYRLNGHILKHAKVIV